MKFNKIEVKRQKCNLKKDKGKIVDQLLISILE